MITQILLTIAIGLLCGLIGWGLRSWWPVVCTICGDRIRYDVLPADRLDDDDDLPEDPQRLDLVTLQLVVDHQLIVDGSIATLLAVGGLLTGGPGWSTSMHFDGSTVEVRLLDSGHSGRL